MHECSVIVRYRIRITLPREAEIKMLHHSSVYNRAVKCSGSQFAVARSTREQLGRSILDTTEGVDSEPACSDAQPSLAALSIARKALQAN